MLEILLYLRIVEITANQPFCVKDGILWVGME